jgi:hypothetical protein
MEAAWNGATAKSKYVYEDTFGAEQHLQKAREHLEKADEAAANMKDSSATVADNFGKGSKAISDALNSARGFDLGGGAGDPFKVGYPGSDGFPTSAGAGAPQESPAPTGGGGGWGGGSGGGRSYQKPKSASDYTTDMKARAAADRYNKLAQNYEERGHYNSAGRMMERADRAAQRVRDNAAIKDYIKGLYGANNMGEAYSEYLDRTKLSDQASEKHFKHSMRERALAESERDTPRKDRKTTDGSAGESDAAGGGSGGGELATEATLKLILNKIKERPILVA